MDHTKRKLIFTKSSEDNPDESINSIENLSNEIFYEIFDYLEGLHICIAFTNLNSHFQQLLTCSSIRYKIILNNSITKDLFLNYFQQIKNQIFSISFQIPNNSLNEFFPIDYSFNNLQSISIENIENNQLISLLIHLHNLPCLYSLNIKIIDSIEDLNQIYQFIFSLPKLKSAKLDLYGDEYFISNNQQLSSIEYLHIAHSYTFDELSSLLSYTPLLRHLKLSKTNKTNSNLKDLLPINLNHLIYLSIFSSNLNFDEFTLFIQRIHSKLKILHVNFSKQDIHFLHADRWQKLLSENFPQLEKFSLRYRESEFHVELPLNQFISSFWIQLNLILDIEIHKNKNYYFVHLFRKRWYEYSKSTQLTIKYVYSYESPDILLKQIKHLLNFTQIYHLNIEQKISIERLMQIIHLLPNLISLKINSLSLYRTSFRFFEREYPTTSALEYANNIKYVYLDRIFTTKDISFLMSFCSHMEYFNVECLQNMNIQLFLREIFKKINENHLEYLRLLCIYTTKADEQMVKELNQMISDEKLLLDYTIHRKLYNIYLKWK